MKSIGLKWSLWCQCHTLEEITNQTSVVSMSIQTISATGGVTDHEQMVKEARILKSSGFKIVVFTGGSVTFGAFSDNDDTTITAYLNHLLTQIGRRVKVYNFAMGSYASDDELASLVMYASDTDPDLLVVMDGYL